MLALIEGVFWVGVLVFDVATFVIELFTLPSAVRDALKDPLRSVAWLISVCAAVVALALWQEHTHLWLAAALTVCAVGSCALAIRLPALRRRGRVTGG